MSSIDLWQVLTDLKSDIVEKVDKIIIFGNKGTEVLLSTRDGCVYGFGTNSFGGLGFGHQNAVKDPETIVELNDKEIVDFSYGLRHVLAKSKSGKLYSWGENSYGQLGIGSKTSDYRPKLIHSLSDKCVIDMSCGYYHTLVLTDDYHVYGFGLNDDGQIGCRDNSTQLKPIKIMGFDNENVVSICCGRYHSLALTQSGSVYGWGYNKYGQLGFGHFTNINIPTKIFLSSGLLGSGLLFKKIVCGPDISYLLTECGDVYGFGYNSDGNLGIGNQTTTAVPTKIEAINMVKDIATHFMIDTSMAKLEDNSCLVWSQCSNNKYNRPKETRLKSFNDIIAIHSTLKISYKTIDCYEKQKRHLKRISDNFNKKEFSDFVFKVKDMKIFINKYVLRSTSDYYKNKFTVKSTEITESSTESFDDIEVENLEIINNYCYEVFYAYLKYLYTESIELQNEYLPELLILSIDHKEEDLIIKCSEQIFSKDKDLIPFERIVYLMVYSIDNNMNELKARCIDRIKRMKSVDNICNVYKISIEYQLSKLKNNCFEFISGLTDKKIILKTDSYKKLSNDMRLEFLEKLIDQNIVI